MVRSLLCSVALSILLVACSQPEPVVVEKPYPVAVYVPDSLRDCPDVPDGPVDVEDQSIVADYVTVLHQVATTCHGNLHGVDDVLTKHEAKVAGATSNVQ